MADDLKTNLATLIRGAGKKKFFFAYGTGKRNDGTGDGHLIIGAKKPKKDEVKEECACQTFAEGHCWSLDGECVLFQGTSAKLGGATVAKMALTAKKLTGKQHDFRVPTPEEEKKAEALGDFGGEEEGAEEAGDGAPVPPPGEDEASRFKTRLEKLMPVLKEAIASNTDVKLLVSQANVAARKKEFAQANSLLDQAETKAKAGESSAGGDGTDLKTRYEKRRKYLDPKVASAVNEQRGHTDQMKAMILFCDGMSQKGNYTAALQSLDKLELLIEAADKEPPVSLQDRWEKRRKNLEPALLTAVKEKRGDTGKMRAVFAFAEEKAEAGDYAKALQGLDQLEKLLQAPLSTGSPDLATWRNFHQITVNKLKTLAGDLAGSKHARGKEAELELLAVIKQLTPNPATAQQVAELETYLKGDRIVADVCELAFDFRTDALKMLTELKSALKK